jgi:hypothetical protein
MADEDPRDVLTAPRLNPRQHRALLDILEQQIALEDDGPHSPRPALGVVDGDGVIYQVACLARFNAALKAEPPPDCRWTKTDVGHVCTACGRLVIEGEDLFLTISRLFG